MSRSTGGARAGAHHFVLRTNSPSGVAVSHSRADEFALLSAAHAAGVTVPEPIALCTDESVIGKPFYVRRRVAGTAAGHILVRDEKWRGDRAALATRLGRELARIHTIKPEHGHARLPQACWARIRRARRSPAIGPGWTRTASRARPWNGPCAGSIAMRRPKAKSSCATGTSGPEITWWMRLA